MTAGRLRMPEIERLAADVLLIAQPVELDGRVSWIPSHVRGTWPVNRYLIRGTGRIALVDTGLACHRDALLEALRPLVADRALDVLLTRAVSLESVGNAAALLDEFPDSTVITTNTLPTADLLHGARRFTDRHVAHGDVIDFDGESRLTFMEAPLKTLFTTWVFDERSRVLFTSDAFGFPAGERDPRELRRYLLARHDWIAHADTDALIERIDRCFDVRDVEVVAPATGAPVVGRAAVKQLREAVTAAIAVKQPVQAFRRPRYASGGGGARASAPAPPEDRGVRGLGTGG